MKAANRIAKRTERMAVMAIIALLFLCPGDV